MLSREGTNFLCRSDVTKCVGTSDLEIVDAQDASVGLDLEANYGGMTNIFDQHLLL